MPRTYSKFLATATSYLLPTRSVIITNDIVHLALFAQSIEATIRELEPHNVEIRSDIHCYYWGIPQSSVNLSEIVIFWRWRIIKSLDNWRIKLPVKHLYNVFVLHCTKRTSCQYFLNNLLAFQSDFERTWRRLLVFQKRVVRTTFESHVFITANK